jgi:KDO2-lipid IV(A) lauroyltransferase
VGHGLRDTARNALSVPQFYIIPKRFARKAPWLAAIVQKVESAGIRLVFWLVRKLPLERANQLSAFVFGLTAPFSDKANKARANLAIAFPDSTEAWRDHTTRQIFRSLGHSATELIKLPQIWDEREQRIDFVVHPKAHEIMDSKYPAIYVSAHVGPWQVAPLVTKLYGLTICTIYAPESNPVVAQLLMELRESLGERLIASKAGMRPLIKELQAGNSINMAMDTRVDSGKLVPFFGREALTSTGAAGLALRTGAALIPARAERLPRGRYRITVYEPLESDRPDAPQKEQVLALTAAINRYFEDWIREYPEQWICLKRRWPKAHKL